MYDIEPGDHFFNRYMFGMFKIRDLAYPTPNERLEFDKQYGAVLQNLVEMRIVKKKLSQAIAKHKQALQDGTDGKFHGHQIDVNDPIDDDLNLLSKDFFIRGKMAVDALIKLAGHMSYPIAFLFSGDEKKFRSGSRDFPLTDDDERFKALTSFVSNHKTAWYSSFREIRRKIEHDGWSLPQTQYALDNKQNVQMILPVIETERSLEATLEWYWQNIDRFCEEIVVFLLSLKLRDDLMIVFIPEEQRDKTMSVRYGVSLKAYPGMLLS